MSNDNVFVKWSPDYSVNIQAIDKQHRELLNILNRLFITITRREGDKAIAGMLDVLMEYTKMHFLHEERLMQKAKYADIEAHKLEHRKLIEQLDQLRRKHLLEEKPIYSEMLGFLENWLMDHLIGVDTQYSLALQKAGFSAAWEREASAEFLAMIDKTGRWWKLW